jgi:hypothetical protein
MAGGVSIQRSELLRGVAVIKRGERARRAKSLGEEGNRYWEKKKILVASGSYRNTAVLWHERSFLGFKVRW